MVIRGQVTIPRRTLQNPQFPISQQNQQNIMAGRPTLPVETNQFPNTISFSDTNTIDRQIQQRQQELERYNQAQQMLRDIDPRNRRAIDDVMVNIPNINPAIVQQELDTLIRQRQRFGNTQQPQPQVQPTQQPMMQSVDPFVMQDTQNILGVNIANPNENIPSVQASYQQMADEARARGDIQEANRLQQLANTQNIFTEFRNRNIDLYNQGMKLFDANNAQYAGVMGAIDQDFKNRLQEGRNIFEQQYGQQAGRIQDLNTGIGALSAKQAAEEQALAQAQAVRTGATPAQATAQINQLATQQLENQLKIQAQELAQYQELYNTYNQLLNNFIQQYAGSTDRNVVQTYRDILNLRNQSAQNLQDAQRQVMGMEMQMGLSNRGGGGSVGIVNPSGEPTTPDITQPNVGNPMLSGVASGLGVRIS